MSQARTRVCLATTSHPVRYSRFFDREARSLAEAGYAVTLIGVGSEEKEWEEHGVRLVTVLERRMAAKPAMVRRIREYVTGAGYDVLHCLDPWTLELGLRLKRKNRSLRVIYEASEHFPAAFRQRLDLPGPVRWMRSRAIERLEAAAVREADVILETNATRARRFERLGAEPVIVANYPRRTDLPPPAEKRQPWFAYTGLVSRHRGFPVLLEALERVRGQFPDARLEVVGGFDPRDTLAGWTSRFLEERGMGTAVDLLGWQPYSDMFRAIQPCLAGVILLRPERVNDFTGQPNKLFEFMGCGLAVIASDFPEIAPVVHDSDCGWLVDPREPGLVAAAMLGVLQDPVETERRGRNGRRFVLDRYNWSVAEARLLEAYRGLSA